MDLKGYMNFQEIKGLIGMQGGVNPVASRKGARRADYERELEIHQFQQAIRKYRWSELPKGMDATMIERILYYRGQLCVFKIEDNYYTLPYALQGEIDVYGRYVAISPLTYNGSINTDNEGNKSMGDGVWIQGLELRVCYELLSVDNKETVILRDYSNGNSQYTIPRYIVNRTHIQDLADILVLIHVNLINSAVLYSVNAKDEGQKESIELEYSTMESELLENEKRVFVITAPSGVDTLFSGKQLDSQAYWECFVSLDNLRENMMGIENTGIFKKKERELRLNVEMEAGNAHLVYQDGLYQRQTFCEIFNALFGENIWCEESEVMSMSDNDNDGNVDDEENAKLGGQGNEV